MRSLQRTVFLAALLALCAGAGGLPAGARAQATNTIRVLQAPQGNSYLASPNGMTLYIFTLDQPRSGVSACTGDCRQQWRPAEIVGGEPSIDPEAAADVGTITRSDDGAQQLTYDGFPLYGYAGDQNPGDMNGDRVQAFGGTFLVAPAD